MADLKNIETMQGEGLFISFNKEEEKKRYISCELEVSNDTKKRAKNPILLKVKQGTEKTLDKIPYIDIMKDNNGDTLIEHSIIKQCIASNREAILKSNKILVEEKDEIKKEINLLHGLYKKQEQEFGKGFSVDNLENMRKFYSAYSKSETVSRKLKLSWSHYIFLTRILNQDERNFYEIEAVEGSWTLRELKRQFNSAVYERLKLSRDKSRRTGVGRQ